MKNKIIFKTLMLQGKAGSTIVSMEKTGHVGTADIYTITFNDGSTTEISLENMSAITSVEKTSSTDTEDIYTITCADGSTQTFSVLNHNADIAALSASVSADLSDMADEIDTIDARVDNLVTDVAGAETTTLWSGSMSVDGGTYTLSESVSNFDFIDIYYDNQYTGVTDYLRIPANKTSAAVYIPMFETESSNIPLEIGKVSLTFSGTSVTVSAAKQYFWDGTSASNATVLNAQNSFPVRIDGVKTSASVNAELADLRVGADGTTYASAGAAVRGQISGVQEDLNKVYVESANIYNQATDRHNTTIDSNGVISASDTYKVSDYIYVGASNKATIQVSNLTSRVFFYTTNDSSGFSRALWITGTEYQTVALAATESYIVIQLHENCPDFMVNLGDTLLPYAPYGGEAGSFLQGEIDTINNKIEVEAESVRESSAQKNLINRFDKTTISDGYYLSTAYGTLVGNSSFFASDYIDVSDLENIMCSGTHIVCFYGANKNFISGQGFNTGSADASIAKPSNAIFMRFSAYKTSLDYAQIGANISRATYVPYGKYTLPDLIDTKQQIVVDASGNGDYTSITLALFENVDSGIDVVVKPGTYDIVAEYVALFGQTAVDNMADADSATFNGFQYGVIIRNRKIEFAAGSHVVCDWTGHAVDGTHRFSAIRVDYNCEIIGLDLLSIATFYAIHDDYGLAVPYTVKYENCRIEGRNLTNANCIGGGCKKYSRHILKNCYFNNNLTGSATVRYHNTNDEGAEPEIYVSNCYFNNWFTPRWYGTQTSKMKVYVNNCEARSIHKLAESSSFNVDNVDLYKWCNTETDPVT